MCCAYFTHLNTDTDHAPCDMVQENKIALCRSNYISIVFVARRSDDGNGDNNGSDYSNNT